MCDDTPGARSIVTVCCVVTNITLPAMTVTRKPVYLGNQYSISIGLLQTSRGDFCRDFSTLCALLSPRVSAS